MDNPLDLLDQEILEQLRARLAHLGPFPETPGQWLWLLEEILDLARQEGYPPIPWADTVCMTLRAHGVVREPYVLPLEMPEEDDD